MPIESLPKLSLGHYPTPFEPLDNLTRYLGKGKLYVKRDDMAGPAFGGNKTRKLEYLLREALDTGCTAVMTFGGTQTNHGRTTVGAAVKLGLKPILVLSGKDTGYLSGNLTLDAMMGADIYFVSEPDKIMDTAEKVIRKYEAAGDKVYVVPVGGSNPLGAAGYIMAVKEILSQMEEQHLAIDHLVCTVGSMGTYAGLLAGCKYFHAPFDVIAVPVSPSEKGEREKAVLEYAKQIADYHGLGVQFSPGDVKIAYGPEEEPFSGAAYNQPDSITRQYIMLMAKLEGIMLDPTYTGKTFRGLVEMVKDGNGYIREGDSVLFLHSGGAMALWTKEHLDDMQEQLRENCRTASVD